jgi:hypothetical protein
VERRALRASPSLLFFRANGLEPISLLRVAYFAGPDLSARMRIEWMPRPQFGVNPCCRRGPDPFCVARAPTIGRRGQAPSGTDPGDPNCSPQRGRQLLQRPLAIPYGHAASTRLRTECGRSAAPRDTSCSCRMATSRTKALLEISSRRSSVHVRPARHRNEAAATGVGLEVIRRRAHPMGSAARRRTLPLPTSPTPGSPSPFPPIPPTRVWRCDVQMPLLRGRSLGRDTDTFVNRGRGDDVPQTSEARQAHTRPP